MPIKWNFRQAFPALMPAALSFFPLWAGAALAEAQGRYALVIGNSAYAKLEPLPNPVRDASDIGGAFAQAGFDVTYGLDVDMRELLSIVQKFAAKSRDGSAVVFFYAGHGFQLDGANHLVPVDATLNDREAVSGETIDLHTVISMLQDDGRPVVVLLDACRNSPLPPELRNSSDQQGLAEIDRGRDLFVAFATAPGKTASSGLGRNSPFTQALLNHVRRPGLTISEMMVDVRKDVYLATEGRQLPWDQSSLRSQFYFVPTLSVIEQMADVSRKTGETGGEPESVLRETTIGRDQDSAKTASTPAKGDAPAAKSSAASETTAPSNDAGLMIREAADANQSTNTAQQGTPGADTERKKEEAASSKKMREAGSAKRNRAASALARKKAQNSPRDSAGSTPAIQNKKNRPSANAYSFSVWRHGNIPIGTSRKGTSYGTIVCKAHYSGWENTENRSCRWD